MAIYLKNFSTAGKVLFPTLLWNLPATGNKIYLTFDDGPIPEVTPWVLSLLKVYDAKATFFCIGDNIEKNPAVFKKIITEGHRVGNHSFNHLNGWTTRSDKYVENVLKTEESLSKNRPTGFGKSTMSREQKIENREQREENREKRTENREQREESREKRTETGLRSSSKLFRPPYGRIKPSQIRKLQKLDYGIVMWDIISGDFDHSLSAPQCLDLVKKYSKPGSIVVFHDSLKAEKNLRKVLPEVLKFYKQEGYSLETL